MDNRIGELRREKGLTLKRMGELLNIRDNTLSQYETGKREPQLGIMLEIANFFGVSLEYLLKKSEIRDYPTSNYEECIFLLEQLKSKKISYDHISLKSALNLLLWVSENIDLLNSDKYPGLIETAYYLRKHIESESKALNWFSSHRKSNNEIINEIIDKFELEDEYNGANPKEVLEFMEQTERIGYKDKEKIFDFIKSLPDDQEIE